MSSPEASLKYLGLALEEAQATVRAYDAKAQIVGIGYTFALNIVANVVPDFPVSDDVSILPVVVFWGLVMVPLFLFGYVLYPSRKIAPKVEGASALALQRVMYVETSRHTTVDGLLDAVESSDWRQEMAFELLKVSRLRELKRGRFIRALFATAASFAFLCAAQVWATF